MNFKEALALMNEGKKVRLSDWVGYWYKDENQNIKAFTRKGETVEATIERYKDRDDWEETDGKMGFDFAVLALKNGKKVAREGWNGKNMWLYLVPGSQQTVMEGKALAAHMAVGTPINFLPHIDMKTADDSHVPWLCSQTDLLSEDWMIV